MVEIDMMAPDWMVALAMRRDLESHFRLVREKAIAQVQPYGVDVASGIESAPGKKDEKKMAAFVKAVRG